MFKPYACLSLRARRALRIAASLLLLLALASCGSASSTTGSSTTPAARPTSSAVRGATPSPPPAEGSQQVGGDWPMYHADSARTGYVAHAPDPHSLALAWRTPLDGAVYAEPLALGGRVLVATEGDSLYALDAATGQVQWRTNVGTPVPLSQLPCGNIDPLGITGTPVYDPQAGLVFAVAEVSGYAHILVGVDIRTGQVRVRRPVDPPGMDPRAQQQRAALALSGGMVYIAFGGLDGDCGNYHGWVVASRTDGQGALLAYQVPTTREGGIWAPSGPAIDAAGNLFVAVGNGAATGGEWDHSDSILKLSPQLTLEDAFAPQQWAQENARDADLGSMGPLLLPGGLVYADGKGAAGYLLQANGLGGIGGQLQTLPLCSAFGGAATSGSLVVVPCTDGLRGLQLTAGGRLVPTWRALPQVNGSPVIGGHTIYSLDRGGTLYALDIASGTVITSLVLGEATSRFATPTLEAHRVYVGTLKGVVAIDVS